MTEDADPFAFARVCSRSVLLCLFEPIFLILSAWIPLDQKTNLSLILVLQIVLQDDIDILDRIITTINA